jgi:hypothetical protein
MAADAQDWNMMTIPEARAILEVTLGGESVKVFDQYMDDMIYCVRSWALTDSKTSVESVRERLENVSRGIIAEAIKAFLADNYSSDTGQLDLNIGETIYDKNMNHIPAIEQIKKHQVKIVGCMVEQCVDEFERGRVLAKDVLERATKYVDSNETHGFPDRDYEVFPPLESMEAEVMRIEARLPLISDDDAARLSEMYRLLRGSQCDGSS